EPPDRKLKSSPPKPNQKQPATHKARGPFPFKGTGQVKRPATAMTGSTESEAEKSHPILVPGIGDAGNDCTQIRNEFGRGGVLFSRLFVTTLRRDNDR
ncbi:hypothetical protein, partial [Mesorhizobium sp. CO1-1-8]|uniref:hypothetical protein n=1 Tax=Mesorhizobium sp. CO1-1-8 TaxID=2876631 RepID=UPI001CD0BA59